MLATYQTLGDTANRQGLAQNTPSQEPQQFVDRAKDLFAMLRSVLLGSLLALTYSTGAAAASFEELPDGRVVLTVLGERLAFRAQDLENVEFYGLDYPCRPAPVRLTLALWRSNLALSTCLNKVLPDHYPADRHLSITLRLIIKFEDGAPFPEKGKKITDPIGTTGFLFPGHISPSELPASPRLMDVQVGVSHWGIPREVSNAADGPPDAMGYELHNAGKPGEFYRLLAEHRIRAASQPLIVACSEVQESICNITIRSSEGFAWAGLRWLGPSPRAEWAHYDVVLRKIADSIFIARARGDLE